MAQASFTRDVQRLACSQWKPAYAAQLCPQAILRLRRAISVAPCPLRANTAGLRPSSAGLNCRALPGTSTGVSINVQFNNSGSPDPQNGDRSTLQQPGTDGHPALTPSAATPAPAVAGANGTTAPGSQDAGKAQRKLWLAAIKPPMYSVGFIPVLVGPGAATVLYSAGHTVTARAVEPQSSIKSSVCSQCTLPLISYKAHVWHHCICSSVPVVSHTSPLPVCCRRWALPRASQCTA